MVSCLGKEGEWDVIPNDRTGDSTCHSKAIEHPFIYWYIGGSARLKHPIRGREKMASRQIHTMLS
jgi:hypothetical protein